MIVLRAGMAAGLASVAPADVLVILSRAVTLTGRTTMAPGALEMVAGNLGTIAGKPVTAPAERPAADGADLVADESLAKALLLFAGVAV